jgi:hypothetical protein
MTLRFTNLEDDRWALLSAEARHAESPDSFEIPSADVRSALRKGDAAELLFDIETREDGQVIDRGVDRMWVVITRIEPPLYVGVLMSDPGESEGLDLRPGTELIFSAEHVLRRGPPSR